MLPRLSPTALLAILQPWAEVAEPIHRRIARLIDAASGQDVLWVGCGAGQSALWWSSRFDAQVQGVDPDPTAIERAEERARSAGLNRRATFQVADATNLPHEARVFDVVIVEMLYLGEADGAAVFREAGRVARPMSSVVGLVPSWLSRPDEAQARAVREAGVWPRLLVEWKSFLRDGGVVELSVEDAALDTAWIAKGVLGEATRAWQEARWSGLRTVFSEPFRTLRALSARRVLGLSIVKGSRWPHE